MKKLIILLFTTIFLIGCSGNTEIINEISKEKVIFNKEIPKKKQIDNKNIENEKI